MGGVGRGNKERGEGPSLLRLRRRPGILAPRLPGLAPGLISSSPGPVCPGPCGEEGAEVGRRPLGGALGSLHSSHALGMPSDPSLGSPLPQKCWSPPTAMSLWELAGQPWSSSGRTRSSRKWADDAERPVQTPQGIPGPRALLLQLQNWAD